jgi:hypothetical protein
MSEYVLPLHELFVRSTTPLGISGLATDDLRIAFLQATNPLCPDVQREIWKEIIHCTTPVEPPPTPKKCHSISYDRLSTSLPRNLFNK